VEGVIRWEGGLSALYKVVHTPSLATTVVLPLERVAT
jgi:hypothetical protein